MSEDREMRTGRHADDTPADEEVRAHVKSRDANDEGGKEDPEVNSGRGVNDEGDDDVRAHVKTK